MNERSVAAAAKRKGKGSLLDGSERMRYDAIARPMAPAPQTLFGRSGHKCYALQPHRPAGQTSFAACPARPPSAAWYGPPLRALAAGPGASPPLPSWLPPPVRGNRRPGERFGLACRRGCRAPGFVVRPRLLFSGCGCRGRPKAPLRPCSARRQALDRFAGVPGLPGFPGHFAPLGATPAGGTRCRAS